MPERVKSILSKYSSEQLRNALDRFPVRDNTSVSNGSARGYIPAEERPIRDRSDTRIDEGPLGFVPVVGDILQGGQAVSDFFNGDYGKAALGAGMLFVPNMLEKPVKPVVQSFKNGLSRTLRHSPLRTIDLDDALLRPYKGQNFIHHDLPGEYVRDILSGETRTMSPSLAVNRWGDYNNIYTPGFYGDHVFIGDKSMLDNSILFKGDGYTPTVGEVWYGSRSVPSDMREKVAEDMWQRMGDEGVGKNILAPSELERADLPFSDQYFEAKYHGTYPLEQFRYGIFPEPVNSVEEKVLQEFDNRGLPIKTYRAVGGNEGYNNKVETLLEVLNDNTDLLFKCGGKKYPGGGKFFRTNLQDESSLMYEPHPVYQLLEPPLQFRPQPDNGDYVYPTSTGMLEKYPINTTFAPVTVDWRKTAPETIVEPEVDLFSDDAIARRALKQRYAESAFNDKAKSGAGAQGAWQIMPITHKDYMGRGRGKAGDLNDPEYNRKVRDWVMGIIPRDLQDLYSENDAPLVRLAKIYGAYNWGAGNMRKYLRKKRDAGEDISNSVDWVEGLNPETKRYIKYLAFDEDIPDSTVYTNAAFEKAAAARGFASGGKIHIKPSKRGTFTAAAKKHGKSVQAFASQVLAHKENYSSAMVKKANFARNAAKWHAEGGLLQRMGSFYGNDTEQMRLAIQNARLKKK